MQLPGYRTLQPTASTRAFEGFVGFSEAHGRQVRLWVGRAFDSPQSQQRFIERARSAILASHPNLEITLDVARTEDGRWAAVTQLVEGFSLLEQVSAHGPLNADDAAAVVIELCGGLHEAHSRGLVHGSIGPSSVVLEGGVRAYAPRLIGLAASLFERAPVGFAPPEAGSGEPTATHDVYALGALLHYAVTGNPPPAPKATLALPEPAAHLGAVITRCLEADPKRRFPAVDEVRRALGRADGTMVSSSGAKPIPLRATQVSAVSAGQADEGLGHMLGPYKLTGLLGEGSMGRVFLGTHTLLGRQVAIKVLRPDQYKQADLVNRFFQEARTVNQINHEHIVEIIDFVQEQGPSGPSLVYCVMELLKGENLGATIARGPLAISRALFISAQICEALAAAHRVGVVHRDVKPDNIFLIERGGQRDYVKVLDFGVAKLTASHVDAPLISTMDGAIIGTPICMAPEQAAGQPVDARADVYALGVILYLMVSGRLPFDAKNFGALAAQIITQPPPPLPDVTSSGEAISPALKALIFRCLEKDPARRPQSMTELRDALTMPTLPAPSVLSTPMQLGREPISAVRPAPLESTPATKPKSVVPILAVGLVLMVAVAFGGYVAFKPADEVVVPPPARLEPDTAVAVVTPAPDPVVVAPDPVPVPTEVIDAGPVDAGVVAVVKNDPPPKKQERPVELSNELIAKLLQPTGPRIRRCFERHRAALKGSLRGEVRVTFAVPPEGGFVVAKLDNPELAATKLNQCMVGVLRSVRFPAHTGATKIVTLPFKYTLDE